MLPDGYRPRSEDLRALATVQDAREAVEMIVKRIVENPGYYGRNLAFAEVPEIAKAPGGELFLGRLALLIRSRIPDLAEAVRAQLEAEESEARATLLTRGRSAPA